MSNLELIGLAGKARTGKDTAAAILAERGFLRYAFADPIRRGAEVMLGLTYDQVYGNGKEQPIDWLAGITPRRIKQTLGTEWGRGHVHRDVWLRLAQQEWRAVRAAFPDAAGLVISDVRFENEAAWIREAGGQVWHVLRDAAPAVEGHTSEDGVEPRGQDEVIVNNGTLAGLEDQVAYLLEKGAA